MEKKTKELIFVIISSMLLAIATSIVFGLAFVLLATFKYKVILFTVSVVFLILILRFIHLASSIKNQFASLSVIGITTIITFHIFINIGMTIGMAPVTGLPLPFLSYGGSSLVTNMLMMGIILNISRNRYARQNYLSKFYLI